MINLKPGPASDAVPVHARAASDAVDYLLELLPGILAGADPNHPQAWARVRTWLADNPQQQPEYITRDGDAHRMLAAALLRLHATSRPGPHLPHPAPTCGSLRRHGPHVWVGTTSEFFWREPSEHDCPGYPSAPRG